MSAMMSVRRLAIDFLHAAAMACCLVVVLFAVGCAQLRVPAIDPTGNYIFAGESTTLELPDYAAIAPKPAFQAAKTPAPCLGPHCAARPYGNVPGAASPVMQLDKKPYVVVMPGRVVAPVGTEVIVASGICGGEGNYVMRQPLEWTVSPDSVGHIVQVGKNEHCFLTDWIYSGETQKLSADRAYTRTFTGRQTVDRGTDNKADDVALGKGQSWVSVTSPVEGATFVNVVAPTVKNWEKRRQTATVYWVDGQWMFPTPLIVRVDKPQPAELITTVARTGMNAPIEGWIVRYEILDGPEATFEGSGQPVIEVPTDVNGQAIARVVPRSSTPGVTQVAVQIIRPSARPSDAPRMVVGQGGTSITWSAPGLAITAMGPAAVNFDEPITYRAEVVNVGDMAAKDVVISYTIPPGTQVEATNPPAQPFGDRLEWRLGDIAPREVPRAVEVTTRMTVEAQVDHVFRARSTDGLAAEDGVRTLVNRSALAITMNGPEQAPVGADVRWIAEIENTGLVPLTNVILTDVFDEGLEHKTGAPSPLSLRVGTLAPGERFQAPLTFRIMREGRHCHRLEARSDDGQKTQVERCVTATRDAVPRVSVNLTGPESLEEGTLGQFELSIRNTGSIPLTNVKVTFQAGSSLELIRASRRPQPNRNGELSWDLPEVGVEQEERFLVECRGVRPDPDAISRAYVTSFEGATNSQDLITTVTGTGNAGGVAPDDGTSLPVVRGALDVTANPVNNPATVGRAASIQLKLRNKSQAADGDVTTSIQVPAGMKILELRSAFAVTKEQPSETELAFQIASLGAGELTPNLELRVVSDTPGDYSIQIVTRSNNDPKGVAKTVELQVVER
jgi:uncharacterized repeat protein (TIGR01451 family)